MKLQDLQSSRCNLWGKDKPPKPELKSAKAFVYTINTGNWSFLIKSSDIETAIMHWLNELPTGIVLGRIIGILKVGDHIDNVVFFDTKLTIKAHDEMLKRMK